MSESLVSLILATAALGAVTVSVVLLFGVELRTAAPLRRLVSEQGQAMALAVAVVATAGSLYYSEIVGFLPCEYCWYQRIAMYPLAVLLAVAVVTRQHLAMRYTMAIAGIGLALSVYHYQLQLFPEQGSSCVGGVSCTVMLVQQFGFVSIPFMAGAGFLSILLIRMAEWRATLLRDLHDAE